MSAVSQKRRPTVGNHPIAAKSSEPVVPFELKPAVVEAIMDAEDPKGYSTHGMNPAARMIVQKAIRQKQHLRCKERVNAVLQDLKHHAAELHLVFLKYFFGLTTSEYFHVWDYDYDAIQQAIQCAYSESSLKDEDPKMWNQVLHVEHDLDKARNTRPS